MRANWELALVQLARSLAVTAVLVAGLAPLWAAAGLGGLEPLARLAAFDPSSGADLSAFSRLAERRAGALLVSFTATALIWLGALVLHCFLEGGILGVLVTADRQAPPGAARKEWFRTFSVRDVAGWGRKLFWRMLGLWLVAAGLCAVWAAVSAGWLGLAALGSGLWGSGAAAGIGCGGALPVAFGWLVLVLWWQLAQVRLTEAGSTFGTALGGALRLVGRRLGGLLVLVAVLGAVALALNVVLLPVSVGVEAALSGRAVARLVAGSLLGLAQWLAAALLVVLCSGALVALARAEAGPGAPR